MISELENIASVYCDALEIEGVVYFNFEADFIEDNVRCIPMIARLKLDACGIKLSLKQWSKMLVEERNFVVESNCASAEDLKYYRTQLQNIITNRTGEIAKDLAIDNTPPWAIVDEIPSVVNEQCELIGSSISITQWQHLQALQRFALVKLCNSSHEHKNLPLALKEFGLV